MDLLRWRTRFTLQPLSPSLLRVAPVVIVALATMLALWVWHVWHPGPLHTRGITLGGVLVVNMDDKTSKWSAMQEELAKSSVLSNTVWGVHRLSGVIGSRCNLHEYVIQGKLTREAYGRLINQGDVVGGHFLTAGALGCYESHVRAWERVVAEGTPTIILEDDVTLRHDFDRWMGRVLERLPIDFGLFYFGNLIGRDIKHFLSSIDSDLYRMTGGHYGTYAYLISPTAALTLLQHAYPAYAQIDSVIIDIARTHRLDVYMSKRVLVATDNSPARESSTQRYSPPALRIPPAFHFVWLGRQPASQQESYLLHQWALMHPSWKIEVWNRTRLPPLPGGLATLVATALAAPDGDANVLASHVVRYAAVHAFGGVYLDGTVEPLLPIESILLDTDAFVVHAGIRRLCSSAFGAVAGHRFVRSLLDGVPVDVPPVGGWVTAGWRSGARLVTSVALSSGFFAQPRTRAFSPHVFFPPNSSNGPPYDPLSYAVHHSQVSPRGQFTYGSSVDGENARGVL